MDKVISSYEMQEILDSRTEPEVKFFSQIPSLDKITEGFRGGELVVITGITKGGKSLLAQTLTVNFLKQHIYSLFFSYELSPYHFLHRFPTPLPLFYMPEEIKQNALPWMGDKIEEAIENYAIKAVFIDHLHFLGKIFANRHPSLYIGHIVRTLKEWTIKLDIVIFLICHTKKIRLEGREEPDSTAARDSSLLSQESDTMFILWRPIRDPLTTWLKMDFHRYTGEMNKKIKLRKVDGLFREVTDLEMFPY